MGITNSHEAASVGAVLMQQGTPVWPDTCRATLGPEDAALEAGPHRASCQPWIEAARASGDVEGLVRAVCAAADDSLILDDLQEASWYVERGLSALACLPMRDADQAARWALADLALTVAQCWRAQGEAARARRLQDLLRDACFDTVRHARSQTDGVLRAMLLHRVAALLEHLGDTADAESLRALVA